MPIPRPFDIKSQGAPAVGADVIDALVWSSQAFGASTDFQSVTSGNTAQCLLWNGTNPTPYATDNTQVKASSFLNYGLQIASDTNLIAKIGLTGSDPTYGTLTFNAGTTGGVFTLTVGGTTTGSITFSLTQSVTLANINAAVTTALGVGNLFNATAGIDAYHFNLTGLFGSCSATDTGLTGTGHSVSLVYSTAFQQATNGFQPKHFQTSGQGLYIPRGRVYNNNNSSALSGFLKSIAIPAAQTFQFYGGFSNVVLRAGTGLAISLSVLGTAANFKYSVSWDWAEWLVA